MSRERSGQRLTYGWCYFERDWPCVCGKAMEICCESTPASKGAKTVFVFGLCHVLERATRGVMAALPKFFLVNGPVFAAVQLFEVVYYKASWQNIAAFWNIAAPDQKVVVVVFPLGTWEGAAYFEEKRSGQVILYVSRFFFFSWVLGGQFW